MAEAPGNSSARMDAAQSSGAMPVTEATSQNTGIAQLGHGTDGVAAKAAGIGGGVHQKKVFIGAVFHLYGRAIAYKSSPTAAGSAVDGIPVLGIDALTGYIGSGMGRCPDSVGLIPLAHIDHAAGEPVGEALQQR